MPDKEIELAKRLVGLDGDHECPLCEKVDWGAIHHADDCPFAMAYAILDDLDDETRKRLLPETNKVTLKWVWIGRASITSDENDDLPITGVTSYYGSTRYYKLQTLVDEKWHDVEIEHNPEDVEGG